MLFVFLLLNFIVTSICGTRDETKITWLQNPRVASTKGQNYDITCSQKWLRACPLGWSFSIFKNIIYLFRPLRRRSWRRRARPWRRQRQRSTPSSPPTSPPCGSWGNRRTSSCASWTVCCCCSSDGSTLYSRTLRRPVWNRPGASLSRYLSWYTYINWTHWTITYQTTHYKDDAWSYFTCWTVMS